MKTIGLANTSLLLRGIHVGFTSVKLDKKREVLTISHNGNMGNTIKHSVDPNLKMVGVPSIAMLKLTYQVIEENGSPDYSYMIKFKIN